MLHMDLFYLTCFMAITLNNQFLFIDFSLLGSIIFKTCNCLRGLCFLMLFTRVEVAVDTLLWNIVANIHMMSVHLES